MVRATPIHALWYFYFKVERLYLFLRSWRIKFFYWSEHWIVFSFRINVQHSVLNLVLFYISNFYFFMQLFLQCSKYTSHRFNRRISYSFNFNLSRSRLLIFFLFDYFVLFLWFEISFLILIRYKILFWSWHRMNFSWLFYLIYSFSASTDLFGFILFTLLILNLFLFFFIVVFWLFRAFFVIGYFFWVICFWNRSFWWNKFRWLTPSFTS